MKSTKYGGLESYFVELQKNYNRGKIIWIYNECPSNQAYINDILKYGGEIRCINANNRLHYMKEIINICKLEGGGGNLAVHFHFGDYFIAPILKLLFPRLKLYSFVHCEVKVGSKKGLYKQRFFYSPFHKILCVSQGVKTGLENILGKRDNIQLHYLGVNEHEVSNPNLRHDLNIAPDAIVTTAIGFNIQIKGFDILLQSIKILKDRVIIRETDKFLIVGVSGDEEEKLLALARNYNVENNIISTGIRNDVADILAISDIYTQPSRTEAISLSIIEAMTANLPVVATKVGGIPEAVADGITGYLCEKENPTDLANKLGKLIENPDLRKQFGAKGKIKSQDFSLTASVQKLIKMYEGK